MARKTTDFAEVLALVEDLAEPISSKVFYGLSGLDREKLDLLATRWPKLPVERRRTLLQALNEISEADFEMDFRDISHLALKDPDSEVRQYAVEGLWEDESLLFMHKLVQIVKHDTSLNVRAAAMVELGRFILLGEYGDIPDAQARMVQETVLEIYNSDEDDELRRRAVEALANCGHEAVHGMIEELYNHEDLPMRQSAVFAMGRTCDADWSPEILREMQSELSEMQYEAIRAAGHLELAEAVPVIARMIDETEDGEILDIAIWALGEIGGERARKILSDLGARAEAQDDEDLYDAAQEALNAANLPGEDFLLFDFDA
jgi:HEAT repeat protein